MQSRAGAGYACGMSKAFTRETEADDDDQDASLPELPAGGKNYITPQGFARLRAELLQLMDDERPKVVEAVHWAAKNGDRSENGDYIYGKKRLREIDRRIRFLTKRLEIAEVVDPSVHHGDDQVFFGATVTYAEESGPERTITIMGVDEADSAHAQVSWVSPIARALLKAREGDAVKLVTPAGVKDIEVLAVRYPAPGDPPALARLVGHVVDGRLHLVVGQRRRCAPRRHLSLAAREAFDRVLVKHFLALRDARAPVGLVAGLGRACHARCVAHRAHLGEGGLAHGVFGGRGRRRRCGGRGCCRRRRGRSLLLAARGEQRGSDGQCECEFFHGYVHQRKSVAHSMARAPRNLLL